MKTSELKTQYFKHRPVRATAVSPQTTPPTADSQTTIWFPLPKNEQRRWPRPSLKPLLLSLGLALVLALFAAAAGGAVLFYNSPYLFPGVTVLDVELGTQTKAEAAAALQSSWNRQPITLTAVESDWTISPADLGLSPDVPATIDRTYEQGRTWASWQQFIANRGAVPVQPVWQLDMTVADAFLQEKAAELAVPAQDARIEIVNGRVLTIPAVPGQALDVTATANWLAQNGVQVVENGRLSLITASIPPTITDISAIAEQATALLTTSVSVRAYDPVTDDAFTWVVSPAVWGDWLTLDLDPFDQTQFTWTLDEVTARTFLDERTTAMGGNRYLDVERAVTAVSTAIQTNQTNVNLRLYHHDQQHIVQPGETVSSIGRDYGIPYPWIQEANPDVGNALTVGQTLIIPSPDVMLPLPVVENKRVVVSINQQKTWVYENGILKWEWPASTGIDASPTAPGVFQIQSHEINAYAGSWNLWMPNFMGIYRPVPGSDFMNGFHGFPTRDGANLLWTNNLGTKVTYGCILLSNENIALLYDWAEEGVVVEILP